MKEVEKFKAEAKKRNLCGQYTQKWDDCRSKKQLFDLAMDSNGIPYICQSMVDGWGLQVDFLRTKFKFFINGRYKSEQKGYTSMMFVGVVDNISADSTNVVVIASNCSVITKKNQIINLFCVNSRIDVYGEGEVHVYEYGKSGVRPALETKLVREEDNYGI